MIVDGVEERFALPREPARLPYTPVPAARGKVRAPLQRVVLGDKLWVAGGGAAWEFALDFPQPAQFRSILFDREADHPNGFVMGVADFFADGSQRRYFARQFFLQELPAPANLAAEDARPRLP